MLILLQCVAVVLAAWIVAGIALQMGAPRSGQR
jgi:hypothetical protein